MRNKESVVEILKGNPGGLIIRELAEKSDLSRFTVRVILSELIAKELVRVRNIGRAKMHHWKEEYPQTKIQHYQRLPQLEEVEKTKDDDLS